MSMYAICKVDGNETSRSSGIWVSCHDHQVRGLWHASKGPFCNSRLSPALRPFIESWWSQQLMSPDHQTQVCSNQVFSAMRPHAFEQQALSTTGSSGLLFQSWLTFHYQQGRNTQTSYRDNPYCHGWNDETYLHGPTTSDVLLHGHEP